MKTHAHTSRIVLFYRDNTLEYENWEKISVAKLFVMKTQFC